MSADSVQHVAEVSLRVDLQFLARRAQAHQNGRRLASLVAPREQPVLTTERNGFERALTGAIVLDREQLALEACSDGVFPLVTNDNTLPELEMLLAYKTQPALEKRFSHLKTDFEVAPVYLKETSRIQALLCVYFLALLTESLLERELRRAMDRAAIESLPLYPEGRKCSRPTARRLIDLFDDVQWHSLRVGRRRGPVVFKTQLSKLQRRLLRLLGMTNVYDK
jgi:hypothetical protein